jgi:hypothetical protein
MCVCVEEGKEVSRLPPHTPRNPGCGVQVRERMCERGCVCVCVLRRGRRCLVSLPTVPETLDVVCR